MAKRGSGVPVRTQQSHGWRSEGAVCPCGRSEATDGEARELCVRADAAKPRMAKRGSHMKEERPMETGRQISAGADWKPKTPDGFTDVAYETAEGIAKITICRPEVRNAFRPRT